jgi:hypothetical protein
VEGFLGSWGLGRIGFSSFECEGWRYFGSSTCPEFSTVIMLLRVGVWS